MSALFEKMLLFNKLTVLLTLVLLIVMSPTRGDFNVKNAV